MTVIPFRTHPRAPVARHGFDAAYVERLGKGEPLTEAHFYAYFGDLIRIKARGRHLSAAAADDIVQETLFRVVRTLHAPEAGLRTPGCLGAFVNSVCNNVLLERYRDQRRHQPPADEPPPPPDTVTPSPEAQLLSKEKQQAVREVLDRMSPEKRELLREVLLEEHDREEVCRRNHVSPDYLRVQLHRAKNEFRALYAEREKALANGTSRPTAGWPGGRPPSARTTSES
jgi:RNA polymerase sigma-70 factor, ECF subfamily